MAALGIPIVPSGCFTGETSTGSQSIGASAAANILMLVAKQMEQMLKSTLNYGLIISKIEQYVV